jgi:predicted esterase
MKKFLLLSPFILFAIGAKAQQTGSFNASITFNGANRTLSNYVPADYNASQSYKLVVSLHGMGDNATNYRNALLSNIGTSNAFPNTILICPDGGSDANRDFYTPAGDEQIIQEAINYARTNYNIDTTEIYLQGFSLGANSALKFGLDNSAQFKGLMLHTPAVQGVKQADNGTSFTYNYANANNIPMYITLGSNDPLYQTPIDRAVAHLAENGGKFKFHRFNGGHTIPNLNNLNAFAFFNQPYNNGVDASIYRITVPERACSGSVQASVLVQNTGNAPIDSITFYYGIGNSLNHFTWYGTLATHQSATVQIPPYDVSGLSTDHYNLEVGISKINAGINDTFTVFNAMLADVHVMNAAIALPFEERFSSAESLKNWAFINSGDYILPFEYDEDFSSLYSINSIFIFDNAGTKEEAVTPQFDLTGMTNAYLHFNVDYNYVSYTADVLGLDTVFADTLEVLVSTDCGENYTSLFKEWGTSLSGHSTPMMNPLSLNDMFFDKDENSYKSFTIDLSAYAGQNNLSVKYRYISALGGYIYLDDVVLSQDPVSVKKVANQEVQIAAFPNPTDGIIALQTNEGIAIHKVEIYSIDGRLVKEINGSKASQQTLDIAQLSSGNFLLKVATEKGLATLKIQKK